MLRAKKPILKQRISLSKGQLLVFLLVFGLIGILIWKSFAAPNPNLPGDLNNDNIVNISDLSILLTNYNTSNATADINSDGTVNVLDMSILLSNYGKSVSTGWPRTSSPAYLSMNSFYNSPLPANVTIDPSSSSWVQTLASMYPNYGLYNNYNDWSTTIYHANASTPKSTISMPVFNTRITIPYQNNWVPDRQSDGHIVVVDDSNGCGYEFQSFSTTALTAHQVRVVQAYSGSGAHTAVGLSGGDLAFLGYIITPNDINGGSINHALGYVTGLNSSNFVTPGTRSDGTHAGGIPEGQLMRLDPSLNLNNLGLDAFQMMVAKALQKYGAYDIDSGGSFNIATEDSYDGSSYNIPINNTALPHSIDQYLQFINFPFTAPVLDSNYISGCSQPY